jgi:hypothetical protein
VKTGTKEQAVNYWLDTPFQGESYKPDSRDDFGGSRGVRFHLRGNDHWKSGRYGIYLGEHDGKPVVALKGTPEKPSFEIEGCEVLEDEAELHRRWELD